MRHRGGYPGQSLVEFALTGTLLIMLLLGTVDLARAYTAQVAIKNAIAEAGYFASQNPRNDAGIRNAILRELDDFNPAVSSGDISINRTCVSGTESTTIRLTYQFNLLFSFVIPQATVNLGSETTVPQFGGC